MCLILEHQLCHWYQYLQMYYHHITMPGFLFYSTFVRFTVQVSIKGRFLEIFTPRIGPWGVTIFSICLTNATRQNKLFINNLNGKPWVRLFPRLYGYCLTNYVLTRFLDNIRSFNNDATISAVEFSSVFIVKNDSILRCERD